MLLPWIKALHLIAMVAWFAGLFYLPRLFVYHSSCNDSAGNERFKLMERKLFVIIMNPAALITILTGLWLLYDYAWSVYASSLWLPLKLALVGALLIFHGACYLWLLDFRNDRNRRPERFYRIANEAPTLILIAIVILVVVKPF